MNWCAEHHLALFVARRVDIECFARDLEAKGKARATAARRLCTIAGLYRYAEEEGLIDHSLQRSMFADLAWITSRTPLAWTATSSAPCSSAPDSPRLGSTP